MLSSGISADPPRRQKRPLWCWASSLAMIPRGGNIHLTRKIVIQTYGALHDAGGTRETGLKAD